MSCELVPNPSLDSVSIILKKRVFFAFFQIIKIEGIYVQLMYIVIKKTKIIKIIILTSYVTDFPKIRPKNPILTEVSRSVAARTFFSS